MGKIKQILGENIRSLRTEKGWTQVFLADRLQITAPFLAQIESGKRGASLEVVERIADILEVPVATLFLEKSSDGLKNSFKKLEVQTIQSKLTENVNQSITNAFEKILQSI